MEQTFPVPGNTLFGDGVYGYSTQRQRSPFQRQFPVEDSEFPPGEATRRGWQLQESETLNSHKPIQGYNTFPGPADHDFEYPNWAFFKIQIIIETLE